MSSPKSNAALKRLGQDIRGARLRRGIAVDDLAVRAGTSPSTLSRLEKGDSGVAIGTLADVLLALGLIERLTDLIDIRKDDLGLALASERLPRRGRNLAGELRKATIGNNGASGAASGGADVVDPDGLAF